MLSLGDISYFSKSIENTKGHNFNNRVEGFTVFYHRDRGEAFDTVKPYVGHTYKECLRDNKQTYNYFWDGKTWWVNNKLLSDILKTKK
jgi:hypothetical protein